MTTTKPTIHTFEAANLGKAPFKCVRRMEIVHCIPGEAPRAGGSCDYCGTGIRYAYVIRDAVGAEFKVGSECVRKTGDRGLTRIVDEHEAADRRAKADVKAEKDRRFILAAAFLAGVNETALRAIPHSKPWAAATNLSFFNEIEWMIYHAGTAGRLKTAKRICEVLRVSPKTLLPL